MMMFALTFGMLLVLTAMMSVGVVFSGKRLQGSCGGVGGSCACDEAGRPRACESKDGHPEASDEAPIASLPAPGTHGYSKSLRSGGPSA